MNQSTRSPPPADYTPTVNDDFSVEVTYTVPGQSEGKSGNSATSLMGTTPPPVFIGTAAPGSSACSPHRRCRLQRSERLLSGGSDSPTPPNSAHSHGSGGSSSSSSGGGQYSSWEVLIRDSFGQIAWPIKFTSWELIDDNNKLKESVPNR